MKIGFANGCFDRFHAGHRWFLTECLRQCDYLIVAVNSDASVKRLKGESRPFDTWAVRAGNVRTYAAAVIPFEGREEALILQIRPEVIFKGHDHSPTQTHYAARVPGWKTTRHGMWKATVVHVTELPGYSTSASADAV